MIIYFMIEKELGPVLLGATSSSLPGGSSKFFNRIAKNRLSMIKLPQMKIIIKMIILWMPYALWWSYITLFQSSPMNTIKMVVNPRPNELKDARGYVPSVDVISDIMGLSSVPNLTLYANCSMPSNVKMIMNRISRSPKKLMSLSVITIF